MPNPLTLRSEIITAKLNRALYYRKQSQVQTQKREWDKLNNDDIGFLFLTQRSQEEHRCDKCKKTCQMFE